jgi:DNA-binding beta-propeller fold protein YncE
MKGQGKRVMRNRVALLSWTAVGLAVSLIVGNQMVSAQGQFPGFGAVPGQKGGQDIFGPYNVQENWPQDLADLPGHDAWTYGAGQGVFAESPDRIFILHRGELPNIEPPPGQVSNRGPGLTFPVSQLPWRNASVGLRSSLPGALDGDDTDRGEHGVDHNWEHCLVVVDGDGNIIEEWTQWDHLFRRPHFVTINPYDPEKHVWVVDDFRHAIFKFTNDGSELVQTIGVPNVSGNDGSHFFRPTFLAFLPDAMFVADGYANTRVVKFDHDGNYLMTWGEKGNPPNETRPGYMNNVHGVAVDPLSRRVFVNDRANNRVQVFTDNGEYLDSWSFGPEPTDIHLIYIGADRRLWAADRATSKILGYDLEGNFLYGWGAFGNFPGGQWGVHGMSVDQDGNFYVAEVGNGRVQKYTPRAGARPETMVGEPVYSAWE